MLSSCRFRPAVSEAPLTEDLLHRKDPRMPIILPSQTNTHHHLPPLLLRQTCCEIHDHPHPHPPLCFTDLVGQRCHYPLSSVPFFTLPHSLTHCNLAFVPLTPLASVTRGPLIAKSNAFLSIPTQRYFGEAFDTVKNSSFKLTSPLVSTLNPVSAPSPSQFSF